MRLCVRSLLHLIGGACRQWSVKDGVCVSVCAFSATFDWWNLLSMKGGVCMCVYELVECIVNDRCSLSLTCFLHEFKIMHDVCVCVCVCV